MFSISIGFHVLFFLICCSALSNKHIYNFDEPLNTDTTLELSHVWLTESRVVRSDPQPIETLNYTVTDDHNYYISQFINEPEKAMSYWVDLSLLNQSITPVSLATNHRRAVPAQLTFKFPFYGHNVKNILITTGGFVYIGDYYHKYLAATQYIAPLMANFDPSIHDDSTIRYRDNGTMFTVEWNQVHLKDMPTVGNFTFQVSLLSDGRIFFVYQQLAMSGLQIPSTGHPVKVGITDAYYNDTTINSLLKKRTIYEYHRVDLNLKQLKEYTAFYLTPKKTCNLYDSCEACTQSNINFSCTWCEVVGRCSNGFDRFRQEWYDRGCDKDLNFVNIIHECPDSASPPTSTKPKSNTNILSCNQNLCLNNAHCKQLAGDIKCFCPAGYNGKYCQKYNEIPNSETLLPKKQETDLERHHRTIGIWAIIFIIFTVVSSFLVWIVYAYRHPTSKSGILLIEIRNFKIKTPEYSIGVKYHHPEKELCPL